MWEYVFSLVENYGLLGVLVGTFLSYSILPLPSDPVIIAVSGFFNPFIVLLVALVGSTLGSITNYYIGLKGLRLFVSKRNLKRERRTLRLYERWGIASIVLFGWLPLVGDPLIIFAGTMKMNFWKFLLASTLGKIWYFIILIWFGVVFFGGLGV